MLFVVKLSERNYPAHNLEFLAPKWTIHENFHDYGCRSEVLTDNNSHSYVLTTVKLDATGQRYITSNYEWLFIKHRIGRKTIDASTLSRYQETPCLKLIMNLPKKGLDAYLMQNVCTIIDIGYFKTWDKYFFLGGVLHCKATLNGQQFLQLLLPQRYWRLCS